MDTRAQATSVVPDFVATSVFLVEDSSVIRERLLEMLQAIPAAEVIGHAETVADAIDQISITQPKVVVLDIKLKGGSGIKVLETIKQYLPTIIVIMLTNYATPEFRSRCLQAGADYFLDKTNEFQNIASIIEQLNCTQR